MARHSSRPPLVEAKKRGAERIDLHPEFAQIGANKLIGTSSWLGQDGKQHQRPRQDGR